MCVSERDIPVHIYQMTDVKGSDIVYQYSNRKAYAKSIAVRKESSMSGTAVLVVTMFSAVMTHFENEPMKMFHIYR
jgi:hypothetical protein